MPFTPFHFGPTFMIGILFASHINMAAVLLASVAIDIEPIYCLITHRCDLHGILHAYAGATLSTAFVIPLIYFAKRLLQRLSDPLGVRQNYSIRSIVVGALLGAWSHVFLDSILYSDLSPFWPLSNGNSFVGLVDSDTIYLITIIGFVVGGGLYFWKLKNLLKAEKGSQEK